MSTTKGDFRSIWTSGWWITEPTGETPATVILNDSKNIVEFSASDSPSRMNMAFVLDTLLLGDDFTLTIDTGEPSNLFRYHTFELTNDGVIKVNGEPWTNRLGVLITLHEDHLACITLTRNSGTDRDITLEYFASSNILKL